MSLLEAIAVLVAGVAAGTINTVVGSGTLVTFPLLLALGYSPVTANVSNTIGLVPGSVSGAFGYREELRGQRGRALRLGACSVAGGITGAIALLTLPDDLFETIVPVFIAVALLLIILQPSISKRLKTVEHTRPGTGAGVYVAGVYGGYFGAAQGILLLGILGLTVPEPLQRINALKNVLAGSVNAVSGVIFVFAAHVAWLPAVLLAVGSTAGGQVGSRYGKRLPPAALRALIVVVGVVAIIRLI